jgi:hypothetical protein
MRLHRPSLHRSYTDPSLSYSRQACIDAAKGFIVIHACPVRLRSILSATVREQLIDPVSRDSRRRISFQQPDLLTKLVSLVSFSHSKSSSIRVSLLPSSTAS